ncbi:MAG: hypothetical protein JNK04_05845 [Myxococcales bacterium]|nr:hypothetical protein [Myxococcales bacterium]
MQSSVHHCRVSDENDPVLAVSFRDGLTSVLIGIGVAYWLIGSAIPALTLAFGRWAQIPLTVLSCIVAVALAVWYASYSINVGRDGVYLGRWRARRFIPVRDITGVTERRNSKNQLEGIHIILRGQPSVTVALKRADHALSLKQRIERLIAAGTGDEAVSLARLARAGRSLADWKKDLALFANGGGFRASAASFEDLDRVLHDPTATPEHRIAAALALKSRAEPHSAQRIRIAAESSVHPKVRVALSELADGHDADAAVEAALAEDALEPDVAAKILT